MPLRSRDALAEYTEDAEWGHHVYHVGFVWGTLVFFMGIGFTQSISVGGIIFSHKAMSVSCLCNLMYPRTDVGPILVSLHPRGGSG